MVEFWIWPNSIGLALYKTFHCTFYFTHHRSNLWIYREKKSIKLIIFLPFIPYVCNLLMLSLT